jgi:hypothetical protein
VDEYGTERARLICSGGESGSVPHTNFELMDQDGLPRVVIQIAGDSTVFQLRYKDQKGHIGFGNHGDPNGAGFGITDENGDLQIRILVPRTDCNIPGLDSMLQVSGRDGKTASLTARGVHVEGSNIADSVDASPEKSATKEPAGRKKKP